MGRSELARDDATRLKGLRRSSGWHSRGSIGSCQCEGSMNSGTFATCFFTVFSLGVPASEMARSIHRDGEEFATGSIVRTLELTHVSIGQLAIETPRPCDVGMQELATAKRPICALWIADETLGADVDRHAVVDHARILDGFCQRCARWDHRVDVLLGRDLKVDEEGPVVLCRLG